MAGARAVIRDARMIGAHIVIENDVSWGARSVVTAHVTLDDDISPACRSTVTKD